ncbi:hypothetical protein VHEMI05582 [[Torrubiella] hemipterigena]|uniref:Glucose-methanol-choline oxidoreductase N-terminal domain-containing protein n=1 Tax=[Torrubiella] hemipterigena TaxID=1531966 RepID=A0A0A1TJ48_9HYPO|nr:hypothetical protein VHEMI05582 [[Torrubiella] hemipterigena]
MKALVFAVTVAVLASRGDAFQSLGVWNLHGSQKVLGDSFGLIGANATFDYIVTGLTVANRLATANHSVAIIEGGGFYELDNGVFSQIPGFAPEFANADPSSIQPLVDWGIVTPPQPLLQNCRIHYTQGKTFGGGSAQNQLAYHRGTKGSYDMWAKIAGDDSYQLRNWMPYFKKSVQFTPPDYGKLGADVSYPPYYHPFSNGIAKAFRSLGLGEINGLNSGKLLGYAASTATQEPQRHIRSSSETSFGQETIYFRSAKFYKQTVAQRIVFDQNKRATGVDVETVGVKYHLAARKEVILSAGAFRSPQLLMLSGIGPAGVLSSMNIPVVKELPGVGQGLQDQNFFGSVYRVNVDSFSAVVGNPAVAAQAMHEYETKQSGPLTNSGANWIGWEKMPQSLTANLSNSTKEMLAAYPADWPDLKLLPIPIQTVPTKDSANYISVLMAVLSTNSRSNVTISSRDAKDNPIVTLPWLASKEDREVAVAALRRARQIAAASGLVIGDEFAPGKEVQSDEDILSFIQSTIAPIHHASCTNRMGPVNDSMAVVDSAAKIYGVQGLRVVDVSAFAILPPGHPQSTVYALAEKIADLVIRGE